MDFFASSGLKHPALDVKEEEWLSLITLARDQNLQLSTQQYVMLSKCQSAFNEKNKILLTGSLIENAINGRNLYIPANESQYFLYRFSHSRIFRAVCNFVMLLQLFLPFAEVPSNPDYRDWKSQDGYLSRKVLTFFDFIFSIGYLFDCYLTSQAKNESLEWKNILYLSMPNTIFRLIACFVIQVDCILWFSDVSTSRFSRILFPFIFISKRSSLRNIVQGLKQSIISSWSILKVLVVLIIMWGIMGFFLFRNLDDGHHGRDTGRLGR